MGLKGTEIDAMLGKRIRLRRTLLGLSQAQLAAQLSFSQQQVALLERGEGRLFAAHLYLLSRVLGVPVDFFFGAGAQQSVGGGTESYANDKPENAGSSLDFEGDQRSSREVRLWVKAFSRIPPGENRTRLLGLIKRLASQDEVNARLTAAKENDLK